MGVAKVNMNRCVRCGGRDVSPEWECRACGWRATRDDGVLTCLVTQEADDRGYPDDVQMPSADDEHFWRHARNQLFSWAIRRYFPVAQSFFEVGCGTGGVLRHLARHHPELALTGMEYDPVMARRAARAVPGAAILRADARALPFAEAFDVVGSFDVVEHIDEDREVMASLRDVVRPGGGVIVSVPQHEWLWSQRDVRLHHKRRYTRSTLRALVEGSGLEVLHLTSFMSPLLPLMAVAAWRNRKPRPDFDPHAELRVGGALDALFKAVLAGERAVLKQGVRVPAGGSLLVVARRRT